VILTDPRDAFSAFQGLSRLVAWVLLDEVTSLDCSRCGRKTSAGNCPDALEDGHVVQCVGEWAEHDKHGYLRTYIEATREARRKFTHRGFIDLFAGPGRVRIRETGELFDGSPLIALKHEAVPFTRVILSDLEPVNIAALHYRTAQFGERVEIVSGDSNAMARELAGRLPPGLNLALIDPFGLEPLRFETIRVLAEAGNKVDLFINFPTSDLRRNHALYRRPDNPVVANALGVPNWRERLGTGDIALQAARLFVESLAGLGYTGVHNRMIRVQRGGSELYRIIFASKHRLGDDIWQSVVRNTPTGQRGLPF